VPSPTGSAYFLEKKKIYFLTVASAPALVKSPSQFRQIIGALMLKLNIKSPLI
jgi:hypothetical protein